MNPTLHLTEEFGSYKLPVYPIMPSVCVLKKTAIEKEQKVQTLFLVSVEVRFPLSTETWDKGPAFPATAFFST